MESIPILPTTGLEMVVKLIQNVGLNTRNTEYVSEQLLASYCLLSSLFRLIGDLNIVSIVTLISVYCVFSHYYNLLLYWTITEVYCQ